MRVVRRRAQRGIALLMILAIVVAGGVSIAVRSFNAAATKADRYRATQAALDEAKAALIAYAVSHQNRPGSLPCPDADNDGNSDGSGVSCTTLIGRLPWITLGLPDLRDSASERLWYAVSDDFQANSTVALNSDTAFRTGNASLTVVGLGNTPVTNIAAIVFAPGPTLQRADGVAQSRACPGTACSVASNFLDISGTDNANNDTTFVAGDESLTFNDRLLPIYSDDIMAPVEKRAGREIAQKLRDHFDAWKNTANVLSTKGFYPWPATFSNPTVASPGVSGTAGGLLPLSTSSIVWTSASSLLLGCSGVNSSRITCTGLVVCLNLPPFIVTPCTLDISGRVSNIGSAFVDPPTSSLVSASGVTVGSLTATWTLNSASQSLDFALSSGSFFGLGLLTVTVDVPAASAWTTSSWLATNNWKQVSYYALSSRFAITGVNDCAISTQCLSITNGVTPTTSLEAVVVTAGRPLPVLSPTAQTSPRPAGTASLSDYFEGENLTPADLLFQKTMRSSQFNDQPVAVRP